MTISWDYEKKEFVRAQLKTGKKVTEVAFMMGTTRNAIIGMCSRSGIGMNGQIRVVEEQRISPIRNRRVSIAKFIPMVLPTENEHKGKPILLLNRKYGQCCYIIGEPKNMKCCGRPALNDQYCQRHYQKCYVKPKMRSITSVEESIPVIRKIN